METVKINNDLIRSFDPCYDPSEKNIPDGETLSVLDWVEKYRPVVPPQDIIWLLCRNEFLSDRDLRLFAVWCAREALSLIDSPDPRSVAACDVAERYANGEASQEELRFASHPASHAVCDVSERYTNGETPREELRFAAYAASYAATNPASTRAAYASSYAASTRASSIRVARAAFDAPTREKQLNQLLTYFEE